MSGIINSYAPDKATPVACSHRWEPGEVERLSGIAVGEVCGSTMWTRLASGHFTEEEWIDTAVMTGVEAEDDEHDRLDVTEWRCANQHEATDEVNDALAELEGA